MRRAALTFSNWFTSISVKSRVLIVELHLPFSQSQEHYQSRKVGTSKSPSISYSIHVVFQDNDIQAGHLISLTAGGRSAPTQRCTSMMPGEHSTPAAPTGTNFPAADQKIHCDKR